MGAFWHGFSKRRIEYSRHYRDYKKGFIVTLSKLIIAPGIFTNESGLSAKGRWIDGDKARFVDGLPQIIGGWEVVDNEVLTGKARAIHTWRSLNGTKYIAYGTNTSLFVWSGGTLADITPLANFTPGEEDGLGGAGWGTGAYSTGNYSEPDTSQTLFPLTWSLDNFGENLIANPRDQGIFEWPPNDLTTPGNAVRIANAPHRVTSTFVSPERIVVAAGCSDAGASTNFDAMNVRWSDIEDNTEWTPSASNQAGDLPLSEGGRIVAGKSSSRQNLIWTDTAIHSMTFLGDPELVFSIIPIGLDVGLIGANAATVQSGNAYWMSSNGQFYEYTGGAPVPIPSSVRDEIFRNLSPSQQDKIFCGHNGQFNEIWWFYPDSRDGNENSRYVSYDYLTGVWAIGQLPRTCWASAGIFPNPIAVDPNGEIPYFQERGNSANGGAIVSLIQAGFIDIGDGDTLMNLNGMVPDFERILGGMTVEVIGKIWPASSTIATGQSSTGELPINANTLNIPFRVKARSASFIFRGNSTPSDWRLGTPRFDPTLTKAKR